MSGNDSVEIHPPRQEAQGKSKESTAKGKDKQAEDEKKKEEKKAAARKSILTSLQLLLQQVPHVIKKGIPAVDRAVINNLDNSR